MEMSDRCLQPALFKVDLSQCTQNEITQVSLDECCRSNTFGVDITASANPNYGSKRRYQSLDVCLVFCHFQLFIF